MWINDVEFLRTLWRHLDREKLLQAVPGLTEDGLALFFKKMADLLEREKQREIQAGKTFLEQSRTPEPSSQSPDAPEPRETTQPKKTESSKKTSIESAKKKNALGPRLIINSDGGFGQKETASIGILICDEDGNVLHQISELVPCETNNESEYEAIIRAAQWALNHRASHVTFRVDSQLVARQLLGQYKVKAKNLLPFYQRAKTLLDRLPSYKIEWVPRKKNAKADALANDAKENAVV